MFLQFYIRILWVVPVYAGQRYDVLWVVRVYAGQRYDVLWVVRVYTGQMYDLRNVRLFRTLALAEFAGSY